MIVAGHRPAIIVSDWNMPEMDGLELCRRVRSCANAQGAYFILVTGLNDSSAVENGLNAGADDFIAKPYRAQELCARVEAGRRIVAERSSLQSRNSALRETLAVRDAAEQRLKSGLAAAAELQRRQLPPPFSVIEGIECGHIFHSAETLAGDGFGYFSVGRSHIAFYMLDVVGHGVSAALNSFAVSRALRSPDLRNDLLTDDGDPRAPSDVVRRLNGQFLCDDDCDQYFTMVFGTLDTRSGAGRMCQAGHPHPIVCGPDKHTRLLGRGGYPVGLLPGAAFENTEFYLAPGERLVLISDGILESGGVDREMFGYDRLSRLLSSVSSLLLQDSLQRIEQSLIAWQKSTLFEDDVSLMVLSRPALKDSP
jgi:sigma-B regulation protein RsbU (phosphoserine phosphatase)